VEGEFLGLMFFGALGLAWFLLPVIDRRTSEDERNPLVIWAGVLTLLFAAVMTVLGYVTP
jgi:quinol-cytochrome oxidoreductase complex cytochrome b subunit